ncbi:hypothetical protein K493DRAFT_9365 [Basidiobolus meristosporus CBS 931.73]|uniref:FHA domain-containing protein n=1 Tax=Basidiobolus meristosporus CBS 931.73 TaxID=1314790 RepID=A0A1Y1ZAB7_9FUNG|nr:hypothetical protein K493DRAFT_9365 [Basidiobolus meristosporus CBS 931.73]|eukprot:ORY06967.1 hypothetical protein K493DRAFT_9365 [Basidiobolus meristosporus CBS 931.73]
MNISDLLSDVNSEAPLECFADFFNNKGLVQCAVPGPIVASARCCEDTVQVLLGSYTSTIILGRGRSATVNLGGSNRKVSRRHAIISWEEATGVFNIHITGANGLFINDSIYKANCTVRLTHGSIIDIAGMKYRFQIPHLDYLPSPPFGSPAHHSECEKKEYSTMNDDIEPFAHIDDGNYAEADQRVYQQNDRKKPQRMDRNSLANGAYDQANSSSDSEFTHRIANPVKRKRRDKLSEKCTARGNTKRRKEKEKYETDPLSKELVDNIVAAIVFSGKHMLSANEIFKTVLTDCPTFPERHQELHELNVIRCLHQYPFFGHVVRKGKDAGGKPLADLWPLVKGARSCTLKDKQYYFKPPPKVPSIRYSTQLPPAGKKRSKKSKEIPGSSKG